LAVAGIIGKAKRAGIEHAQEPLRSAAVLHVGLPSALAVAK
jgi:hypothetical protein